MKKARALPAAMVLGLCLSACGDGYLDTTSPTILTDEVVWTSPQMITGVIANYYGRLPDGLNFGSWPSWGRYDEALYSGITVGEAPNQVQQYPISELAAWNGSYSLIRDINLAIESIEAASSPQLTPLLKSQFTAELRFQRAWVYFDLVKRMGGVPIITEQLIYDFSGDPSTLRKPRNKESEVYDFIAQEVDEIADVLANAGNRTRANKYTALALKSRAMLYAASVARHTAEAGLASTLSLPNEVVGIPASRAAEYYTKSLDASEKILNSGAYSLYETNPDRGQNFYEALTVKAGNPETIWVLDYKSPEQRHQFTVDVIIRSQQVDGDGNNLGAGLAPSLQLVENFDYLDSSPGVMKGTGTGSNTAAGQTSWIFYNRPEDIFANKDARLYGTVVYPGATLRGKPTFIQAGVYVWNATTNKYDRVEGARNTTYTDGGTLTGADGPRAVENYLSTTGFYIRKFVDPAEAAVTNARGSDIAWVRFRLGEIYMNATEAAFELGQTAKALQYINRLRQRAGFPANSLNATTLTRDKIRSDRWAELAFEDHRVWDLKRWRTAHLVWNGQAANNTSTVMSLWGYRIVRPGHPDHGKFVYDKFRSTRQTFPRFWQLQNYYSQIPEAAIGNNPNLIRNPLH